MSDLRLNAIAGAVLATGLSIMGIREIGHIAFHQEPTKGGFALEVVEEAPKADAGAEAPKLKPDWGVLLADAAANAELVAAGEKAHRVCASCHSFDPGGANGTGPALYGVFGRAAGTHAGFTYTDAMTGYAKPWSYDNLYDYLENPKAYVPGTSMSFAGVRKQEDRVALVAYLRSLSPAPAALPAPDPTRDPAQVAAAAAAAAPAEGAAPAAGAAAPAEGAPAPAAPAAAPAPAAG